MLSAIRYSRVNSEHRRALNNHYFEPSVCVCAFEWLNWKRYIDDSDVQLCTVEIKYVNVTSKNLFGFTFDKRLQISLSIKLNRLQLIEPTRILEKWSMFTFR